MDWHRIIFAFLITLLIQYSNHMVITDLQLVGGPSSNKGTVEVKQDGDAWETTCGINLDFDDVIVICRQLGFTGASLAMQTTPYGQNSTPYIGFNCNGSEGNIAACPTFSNASGCSPAGAASCHGERYLGCFKDVLDDRVLSSIFVFYSTSMRIPYCIQFCQESTTANYTYAGLGFGKECYCGEASDNYTRHGVGVDSNCSLPCHGDPTESCGGTGYIAVFRISAAMTTNTPTTIVATSPLTTTSIVPSTNQEVITNGGRISTPSPSPSTSSSRSTSSSSSSPLSSSSSSSSSPSSPSSSSSPSPSSSSPSPSPSPSSSSSSSSLSSPPPPPSSSSSSSSSSLSSSSPPPSSSSSSPTEPQRQSNLPTTGNSTVLYAGIGGGVATVVIIAIIVFVAIVCFTKRSQQRIKGIASSQRTTLTQASRPPEYEEISDFGISNGVIAEPPYARGVQPGAQAHSSANSSRGDKNVLLVNLNPNKSSNIYEGTMDETQEIDPTSYASRGATAVKKSNDRLSVLYAMPDKNGNGAQDGYDEINLGIAPYSSFENSEQPTASATMADRMSVVYAAPDKNHERNVTSEDMDSLYAMPDKNGNRNPSDDTSDDVGSLYAMPDKSRGKPDGRDSDQDPYAKYNDSFSGDQYNEMEMVENELYTM